MEMHLEAMIVWTGRWTRRLRSREFGDALGGRGQVRIRYSLGGYDRVNSEMHLKAVIERVWRFTWRQRSSWTQRCTWRPWLSKFGDAFGGRDRVTEGCTWRLSSSKFGDALGGYDHVTHRCTWGPWLSKFGDALCCCDRACFEMH